MASPLDRPSTPGALWICSHRLRWPSSAASARVSLQLFLRVFEELRGADTPFSSTPWSVKVVSGLLELLHNHPHLLNGSFSFKKKNFFFDNFSIPNLKVDFVSFQMFVILRKLISLKVYYRITKLVFLLYMDTL